jgi:hypothetical protein
MHQFKENDPSSLAKSAYDVVFKALARRSKVEEKIKKKQQALAHLLFARIANVFKAYSALLIEGRAAGSDLEAESKFLLKRMSQLETGPGTFEKERDWIKAHIGSAPVEESAIWRSSRCLLIIVTPFLLNLLVSPSQDIRGLIAECLQLSHSSLIEELAL